MGFIFWMSTGEFSFDNTSLIIGPVLHFLFPSFSEQQIQVIHGFIRKAAHVTEYFVLGLILIRAFCDARVRAWKLRWSAAAVTILAFYAMSDEFHQSFVSTRTASIIDVGIDTIGGIISQVFIALFYYLDKKRKLLNS